MSTMADAFIPQMGDATYDSLTFEERFGMIVDVEWARRRSTKLQKLIRTTCFRYPNSCMEDIEYHPARKLNKPQLLQLSTYRYIRDGYRIILGGASGTERPFWYVH